MASPGKSNIELLRQALAARSCACKVVRIEWCEDASEALEL